MYSIVFGYTNSRRRVWRRLTRFQETSSRDGEWPLSGPSAILLSNHRLRSIPRILRTLSGVFMTLEERFARRTTPVAVIGQGYVGLPLAVEFARAGFPVYGIDVDEKRIARLAKGQSYIQDVPTADLAPLVRQGRLKPTTDFSVLRRCGAVSICVPTPLSKTR